MRRFAEVVLQDASRNAPDDEEKQSSYIPSANGRRRRLKNEVSVQRERGSTVKVTREVTCQSVVQLPTPGKYASRRRGTYRGKIGGSEEEGPAPLAIEIPGDQTTQVVPESKGLAFEHSSSGTPTKTARVLAISVHAPNTMDSPANSSDAPAIFSASR
jgi:hypothetical protein